MPNDSWIAPHNKSFRDARRCATNSIISFANNDYWAREARYWTLENADKWSEVFND